jgi:hypothetical protein
MPGVSCGPLAQSVEQKTFNLLVDGSNPSRPTICINHLQKNFSILEMSVEMVRRLLESNVLLMSDVNYCRMAALFIKANGVHKPRQK